MGQKQGNSDSGLHPGKEIQKHKKHRPSRSNSFEGEEGKVLSKSDHGIITEKLQQNSSSWHDLGPQRANDFGTATRNENRVAFFDQRNNEQTSLVQKKANRKRGQNANKHRPSGKLHNEVGESDMKLNSESVGETSKMGSKRPSNKESNDSKGASDGAEKLEKGGKISLSSFDGKSSCKVKLKRYARRGKEKLVSQSHSSDSSPSLANAAVLYSSRSNNCEASVYTSISPLDETGSVVSKNGPHPNVKKGSIESGMNPKSNERIRIRPKTYRRVWRVRKSGSSQVNVSKNCTSTNSMSASQGTIETSTDNQKILLKEECLTKSAYADVVKNSYMPPEIDLKTSKEKRAKSRRQGKHRRRGKTKPADSSSVVLLAVPIQDATLANDSSLPGFGNLDSSKSNSGASGTLVSLIEKDDSYFRDSAHVESRLSETLPDILSELGTVKIKSKSETENTKQEKINAQDFSDIDQSNLPVSSSSFLETSEMGRDQVAASFEDNSVMIVHKEDCSFAKDLGCAREQIPEDMSGCVLQVVESGEVDSSDKKSTLGNVKKRTKKRKLKHTVQEQKELNDALLHENGDFLDEINSAPEMRAISVRGSPEHLPNDCKEKVSLPPSPIRGVIDDFVSSEVQKKQNGMPALLSEGEGSFSFQITSNILKDKAPKSSSAKAVTTMNEIGAESVKPKSYEGCASNTTSLYCCQKEEKAVSLSGNHYVENVSSSDVTKSQDKHLEATFLSPARTLKTSTRKKLLVLDLNGLLADIILDIRRTHTAQKRVGGKSVFTRPFYDDFLKFCFERFDIGIWSSRKRYNVNRVVEFLMGEVKHKLLFCWDQSHCTTTGFRTIENFYKPLVFKELKKLWDKEEPDLPWEIGEYSPSNTLLIDDSPYKALRNPPHTGIFPRPYSFSDENDSSLGPGGDLRVYLEGLAMANDVQQYVREHPFGQAAITEEHPDWDYYHQIVGKLMEPSNVT